MAQIFVYGESTESWLLAVVVPDFDQIKKNCETVVNMEESEILTNPEVIKMILDNLTELAKINKLNGIEKIKKVHLTNEMFTVENDILTPTFKIKRNVAKKVF